jgi:predicted amidohydrolase
VKIAAIQHEIAWEDAPTTHARIKEMLAEAADAGAQLLVLPEMFATGFSMRPERIAEEEGGPSEQFLRDQARATGADLLASIAQRGTDGGYRNNAVLARPDGTVERYAKIHPFTYAGEHEQYTAGADFLTTSIRGVGTSVFVCYDLRFADEFWQLARRTDLYVVVANWPSPRHEHWRVLLRARAIENQAYALGVNRVGRAGRGRDLSHSGGSALIDPLGTVLFEGDDAERVLLGDVDPAVVADVRARFPFLPDRR